MGISPEINTGRASDERRRNVTELGEQLIAVLENPETPAGIQNFIADKLNDLIDSAPPDIASRARQNWPRIAEMLMAKSEQEGDEHQGKAEA